jgi:hypothetical protein
MWHYYHMSCISSYCLIFFVFYVLFVAKLLFVGSMEKV